MYMCVYVLGGGVHETLAVSLLSSIALYCSRHFFVSVRASLSRAESRRFAHLAGGLCEAKNVRLDEQATSPFDRTVLIRGPLV